MWFTLDVYGDRGAKVTELKEAVERLTKERRAAAVKVTNPTL